MQLEPPLDLTVPRSTETLRAIISLGLRSLLTEIGRLPLSAGVRARLRELLASSPGRVFAALRRPTVSTLIRCSRATPDPRLSDVLAAELGLGVHDDVPCLSTRRPQGTFHVVEHDIQLALIDVNPLAMREAHPDKCGNAIDLGGHPVEAWCAALRRALEIIETDLPIVREEIDLLIEQLVPVGWDEEAHLSASYKEAVGTIYLSLHPDEMTMAEALVHEHQHNKLNALFDLDRLLENDPRERYASPVRPDPRPLHGVLLAVHAFLPIEALYRRLLERGTDGPSGMRLERRYEEIVALNRAGAKVLREHARPTPVGRGVLDEIARLS